MSKTFSKPTLANPRPLFVRPAHEAPNQAGPALNEDPVTVTQTPPPPSETPPVPAARMRSRHWMLLMSFMGLVLMPIAVTAYYLWAQAEDQYSSVTGFIVRQEEGQGASELLGGLAVLAGRSSTTGDSDILYDFISSQALIQSIKDDLDIMAHYSANWSTDPVFSLTPDATIEDIEDYWQRVVRVSYNRSVGLMEVRVLAFDPVTAQSLATLIRDKSQEMINALNTTAREDAMRYARTDLDEAVQQLGAARSALTEFRTRTQIVDPQADIQGRMGVMNNLQQQLAQSLIDLDLLTETTSSGDQRLVQAQRRIDVIRDRLAQERDSVASGADDLIDGQDYPTLIAEFEGLVVDREFAEQNYGAALAALDLARDNVARQSRYLATFIEPTRAESSEFPKRFTILGLAVGFFLLSWAVMTLIYYSIRDRG